MIKPILNGRVNSFELRPSASQAYNEKIQSKLRNTVFSDCFSWYRGGEFIYDPAIQVLQEVYFITNFSLTGSGHNQKIIGTYPGFHANFWWNTLVPRWEDSTLR